MLVLQYLVNMWAISPLIITICALTITGRSIYMGNPAECGWVSHNYSGA